MAAWLLIVAGGAALVVVVGVLALVWVLSGRAKPGGVSDPNNVPGVAAAHAQSERTNIQSDFGQGPGF